MSSITKPYIEFIQTDRIGRLVSLSVRELLQLMPTRPPEQLATFLNSNRPINVPHYKGILTYLVNTPNWAMPPLIFAMTKDRLHLTNDGLITLDSDYVRLLDGQHRVQALAEFVELESEITVSTRNLGDDLGSDVPIVIFEVKDRTDQEQMFAWFAKNRPINNAERAHFDHEDPFNSAANRVSSDSTILNGRINMAKDKVAASDDSLLTMTELGRIASTIVLGLSRRVTRKEREHWQSQERRQELYDRTLAFFDEFLPLCGAKYAILSADNVNLQLSYERNGTYAYDIQTLRLFADCWARWVLDQGRPREILAGCIAGLNLSRVTPENDMVRALGVVDAETRKYLSPTNKQWGEASSIMRERANGNAIAA